MFRFQIYIYIYIYIMNTKNEIFETFNSIQR